MPSRRRQKGGYLRLFKKSPTSLGIIRNYG
jgi:hypothetical protein